MGKAASASTTAEWRNTIVVTLRGQGSGPFHRLSTGEIVDDQGNTGANAVPAWVVDSLTPNARPATPAEVAAWLARITD
ncbi:MAG: hypothetical protein OEL76_17785 [Siculibacillus sp.]|nr:hypothetical protein [Siculibacillus sp.]